MPRKRTVHSPVVMIPFTGVPDVFHAIHQGLVEVQKKIKSLMPPPILSCRWISIFFPLFTFQQLMDLLLKSQLPFLGKAKESANFIANIHGISNFWNATTFYNTKVKNMRCAMCIHSFRITFSYACCCSLCFA